MRKLAFLAAAALVIAGAAPATSQVVEYYHLDAIGNIRAVSDAGGTVIERHDYLPFGEECLNGPCGANPQVGAGQPRKFTGKERDQETGLDYFGARYYGSKIGRFTTTDPVYTWNANLTNPQRWNRYAYALNNPLRFKDPDGRIPLDTIWDAGNVIVDIYTGATTGDWTDLGVDALAMAIPYVPAGVTKLKHVGKVDDAIDAAKGASNITDAGKATAKEGRYEFPDQTAGGIPYVGEAVNIPRRLGTHARKGRLTPGTEETTEVLGGKTAREIAEHKRIQELTGGVPASKSDKVSNKKDPIGPKRQDLLKE